MDEKNYYRDLLVNNIEDADVIITGLAYDKGCSCGKGASLAPERIRKLSSYLPATTKDGNILDSIKLFDNGIIKDSKDFFDKAEEEAKKTIDTNKFNIFIGGDHSCSIPLQKAFLKNAKNNGKVPAIIHLDAHPDFCEFYDGSKMSHACTNARAIENGYLYENITLIGIRGFEKQEVILFNEHKEIALYTSSIVKERNVKAIIEEIVEKYKDKQVYISFDIDIVDPSFAPGTGTPEAFGLSNDTVLEILMSLLKELDVRCLDIMEVSPANDVNDITSWLALKYLYEVLGLLNRRKK